MLSSKIRAIPEKDVYWAKNFVSNCFFFSQIILLLQTVLLILKMLYINSLSITIYVEIHLLDCIWKGYHRNIPHQPGEQLHLKKQIQWKQPPWGENCNLPLAFSPSCLVNVRPKGINQKANTWLKISTKNIQHPSKPSGAFTC